MRKPTRAALMALVLLLTAAQLAPAQTPNLHLGARAGYHFKAEEFFIGAQFSVPLPGRFEAYPSFDYYFVEEDASLWAFNADIKWRVAHDRPNWLYLGAGLNLSKASAGTVDDTDVGVNLFTGVEPLRGRIHPFAEGRLTLGKDTGFQLQAGFNITIGH